MSAAASNLVVGARVEAVPGFPHPAGVVLKIVERASGLRLVQCETLDAERLFVAVAAELRVVPVAGERVDLNSA
ncbi:hypothetical protein GCM10023205_40690 [Yinghuangia aomiensis]|uniref:Uncharacterized protein n=1 Tax=Yinghuangia aomiensis TaxID=676205 RepID=A0ABP9HHI2_9ACTN